MRGVIQAWKAAEEVLGKHSVKRAPVRIEEIAESYATLVMRPLEDDISGALIPIADNEWTILVNEHHHENRRRFTIAHELGHLILHGYKTPHADKRFRLRDARSSEGSALEEIQANQFAAELLMPRSLIMKALRHHNFEHSPNATEEKSFEKIVGKLAKDFAVSRQAMTVRLSSLFA